MSVFKDPVEKKPRSAVKIVNKGKGVSTSMSEGECAALQLSFAADGPDKWEYVTQWKFRVYDGHYVVVRIEPPGKLPFYADLARGRGAEKYEFQNDSLEMTDWQWQRLSIPVECDWFDIPDEPEVAK